MFTIAELVHIKSKISPNASLISTLLKCDDDDDNDDEEEEMMMMICWG